MIKAVVGIAAVIFIIISTHIPHGSTVVVAVAEVAIIERALAQGDEVRRGG